MVYATHTYVCRVNVNDTAGMCGKIENNVHNRERTLAAAGAIGAGAAARTRTFHACMK